MSVGPEIPFGESNQPVRPTTTPSSRNLHPVADPPPHRPGYGSYGGYGGYGYEKTLLGDSEVSFLQYVQVLYRRRYPCIATFLIVMFGALLYTFTRTPIYQATTKVLIEKETPNVVTFKEAFEQDKETDDYYETQYRILQSRGLARRTLDKLNLWKNPQFTSVPGRTASAVIGMPVAYVQSWLRPERPLDPPDVGETKEQSRVIDAFLRNLNIAPVRFSRLVDVRFDSFDPKLATDVANTLANAYIEESLEVKYTANKSAEEWLGGQMLEQRKRLDASEQALQQYREQTDSVSLEDRQNIVVQKLTDLNAALTKAKTDRIQKETAYLQIKGVQSDQKAIDTIPLVLANVFVQQQKAELADLQRQHAQLSEKFGPNHPEMQKLVRAMRTAEANIQGEIGKIVVSMRNDYEAALTQERTLSAALDQQKAEALDLNRKSIDYNALQRDKENNQRLFESLMQRAKETGISGALKTSNIRIIDPAEQPQRPYAPNTFNNLVVALLAGLTLALGLAFGLEYVDDRIKNPDEIKNHLHLPFLGMMPRSFLKDVPSPIISGRVPANFAESIRSIRTNVLFSTADEGGRMICVTSTGPGEGKTLVTCNLALALAQAGQRVLLVDADLRKPRVHEVLGRPLAPGLSNVLVGETAASAAVSSGPIPDVWVLTAGAHPPNPAELLGSRRFRDFMASCAAQFDWVLVDTPPVMAVTDAPIVAHLAKGVVFVIGAEMTSRKAAQRAIEQLQNAQAKFLGAVLNKVNLEKHGYYYSQYYRKEYSDYYQKAVGE